MLPYWLLATDYWLLIHPSSFRLHPLLARARARVADGRRDGQLDLDGAADRVVLDLPRDAGRVGLALKLYRDGRVEAVVRDRQSFERRDAEARVQLAAQSAARGLEGERRRVLAEGRRHFEIPLSHYSHFDSP